MSVTFTRKKLARLFWCVDGSLRWVCINLRGKAPKGFENVLGSPQRIIKGPSDAYLARLERALPKLQFNGYVVQKVEPVLHPGSPGGWCVF